MKQGCYAFLPSFVAPSVEFVHTVLVAVSALIAILDDVFQVRLVLFYPTMREHRWVYLEPEVGGHSTIMDCCCPLFVNYYRMKNCLHTRDLLEN